MSKPKLLNATSILAFTFIFAITSLDIVLSFMGWKPTFGDDLLAGIIGFLPSVGSVSLSMLIGVTLSWKTKILSSIIWLFCITISLTGNFLNMTARAFESLETENIAKVEVSNVKDSNKVQIEEYKKSNQERVDSLKIASKEQLDIFDQEIAELTKQYETAREARDFQINDGVNRDGTMGPKARAFQASMDRVSEEIEKKRNEKRQFQKESTADLLSLQNELTQGLLQFHEKKSDKVSEANIDLAETQSDMRGHMPVIRYFLKNADHQRNVVLWGLGLFAAVISLAGPVVSYAMAVHLNHKKLLGTPKPPRVKKKKNKITKPKKIKQEQPKVTLDKEEVEVVEEEVEVVEDIIESNDVEQPVISAGEIFNYYSKDMQIESLSSSEVVDTKPVDPTEEQKKASAVELRKRILRNNGYI